MSRYAEMEFGYPCNLYRLDEFKFFPSKPGSFYHHLSRLSRLFTCFWFQDRGVSRTCQISRMKQFEKAFFISPEIFRKLGRPVSLSFHEGNYRLSFFSWGSFTFCFSWFSFNCHFVFNETIMGMCYRKWYLRDFLLKVTEWNLERIIWFFFGNDHIIEMLLFIFHNMGELSVTKTRLKKLEITWKRRTW